ncbi:MAG: hypothetical protein ISQ32_01790 [Rickettsiales bacterium]|nr:hypothetical protein [Rickettsiales bacterium]
MGINNDRAHSHVYLPQASGQCENKMETALEHFKSNDPSLYNYSINKVLELELPTQDVVDFLINAQIVDLFRSETTMPLAMDVMHKFIMPSFRNNHINQDEIHKLLSKKTSKGNAINASEMIVLVELFNKESTSDKQDLLKFELFKALSSCDIKPRETFKIKVQDYVANQSIAQNNNQNLTETETINTTRRGISR